MKLFASCVLCLICFHLATVAQQPTSVTSASINSESASETQALGNLQLAELMKRAHANDPAAQNELALRYRYGTGGVEKDNTQSVEWLHKAAVGGVPISYFNLGVVYYNGDGVPIDDKQSCKWFILANDAGVEQAREAVQRAKETLSPARFRDCESLVATAYYSGKEIRQDYARALDLYKQLATEGYGEASERLAVMYDHGLGVASDSRQSVFWLQRGAEQGNSLAQYELGRIYELGIAGSQDYPRALKLYEASANGSFTPALVALSKMYMDGRGVKANSQTAFMWALLAVDRGNAEAISLADSIAAQLSKKQIQAAKKEALLHKAGQVKLTYAP